MQYLNAKNSTLYHLSEDGQTTLCDRQISGFDSVPVLGRQCRRCGTDKEYEAAEQRMVAERQAQVAARRAAHKKGRQEAQELHEGREEALSQIGQQLEALGYEVSPEVGLMATGTPKTFTLKIKCLDPYGRWREFVLR